MKHMEVSINLSQSIVLQCGSIAKLSGKQVSSLKVFVWDEADREWSLYPGLVYVVKKY